jgi:hypothetical protein
MFSLNYDPKVELVECSDFAEVISVQDRLTGVGSQEQL